MLEPCLIGNTFAPLQTDEFTVEDSVNEKMLDARSSNSEIAAKHNQRSGPMRPQLVGQLNEICKICIFIFFNCFFLLFC